MFDRSSFFPAGTLALFICRNYMIFFFLIIALLFISETKLSFYYTAESQSVSQLM